MVMMSRLKTYFLATRPQFFPGIAVPVCLGAATAWNTTGAVKPLLFFLTIVAAVLYHGGMNVFNDYFDSLNGADENNTKAITPFTGGSRFIQRGLLTRKETFVLAAALVAAGSAIGLYLAWSTTPLLIIIGVIGMLSGFFYTAPPVFLAGRGLGELTVGLNFGLLTVMGSYLVQTSGVDPVAVFASLPISFLIMALLYINEFPDCKADAAAGKRTLVVRLGPRKARYGFLAIVAGAYLSVVAGILTGHLPAMTLIALVTLPVALPGVAGLIRHYGGGKELLPSIKSIILTHLSSGVLLIVAFII